ncbi:MAG: hypothetical protein FWC28_02305 [Proteobacteria bacterium]|nr:hypothetical protein [Pseudomonadota bacterium]
MSPKVLWILGFFLWHAEVLAQEEGVRNTEWQKWSVVGGKTIGAGFWVFEGGLENTYSGESFLYSDKSSGVRAGFSYGASSKLDLGLRFTFSLGWGDDYRFNSSSPKLLSRDFKIQALFKIGFVNTGFFSFSMKIEPGFHADFFEGTTVLGFALPVNLQLSWAISRRINLSFLLDSTLIRSDFERGYRHRSCVSIFILMGAGLEIFFTPNFLLHAAVTLGPAGSAGTFRSDGGANIFFATEAKAGLAYRF